MQFYCKILKCLKVSQAPCRILLIKKIKKYLTRQNDGAKINENKGCDEDGFRIILAESRWLVQIDSNGFKRSPSLPSRKPEHLFRLVDVSRDCCVNA